MSSKKFNPAELLKLSIYKENNDHMRIFHEFEVVQIKQTACTTE